jgi:hypothetical protein
LLKSISGCCFMNLAIASCFFISSDVGLPIAYHQLDPDLASSIARRDTPSAGCQTSTVSIAPLRTNNKPTIIFSTIALVSPSRSDSFEFSGWIFVVSIFGWCVRT